MRRAATFWLFGGALFVGLSLAACSARRPAPPAPPAPSAVVPETGVVHDLGNRQGELVVAVPGDALVVPLVGEAGSGYQWSYRAPINGGYLSLKKHVVTERDARLKPGQRMSEWTFKIEKPATFTLRLEYENPTKRQQSIAKDFTVKVVADKTVEQLEWLLVDQPRANGIARGSFEVAGFARAAAGPVTLTVSDADGATLATTTLTPPTGGPAYYAIKQRLSFRLPSSPLGALRFAAAESGSPLTPVVVPLVFNPEVTAVKVYWGSRTLDPESACDRVFGVTRGVATSGDTMRLAVDQLLSGPNAAERRGGYFTSLPAGVKLRFLSVKDGAVTADFTPSLERGVGGSCRVAAIRQQIEQTLKQFPGITAVVITVDGRTDDVLQP